MIAIDLNWNWMDFLDSPRLSDIYQSGNGNLTWKNREVYRLVRVRGGGEGADENRGADWGGNRAGWMGRVTCSSRGRRAAQQKADDRCDTLEPVLLPVLDRPAPQRKTSDKGRPSSLLFVSPPSFASLTSSPVRLPIFATLTCVYTSFFQLHSLSASTHSLVLTTHRVVSTLFRYAIPPIHTLLYFRNQT